MQINQIEFPNVDYIQPITDANQIITVIHNAFKRYESDSMPSSALAETSETIKENLKDGIVILGAYIDTQLVGVIKISQQPDSYYFSRLSVLPTYQKKGIASALVTYVEKMAFEEKLKYVLCKVRKKETDNIRLYEKLDYRITKEEQSTSPTGFIMDTVTMKKEIFNCYIM